MYSPFPLYQTVSIHYRFIHYVVLSAPYSPSRFFSFFLGALARLSNQITPSPESRVNRLDGVCSLPCSRLTPLTSIPHHFLVFFSIRNSGCFHPFLLFFFCYFYYASSLSSSRARSAAHKPVSRCDGGNF